MLLEPQALLERQTSLKPQASLEPRTLPRPLASLVPQAQRLEPVQR